MPSKGILKVFAVGFLCLGLWIALIAIGELVSERSQRRQQILTELAQTTAGEQIISGPVLVMPYELESRTSVVDAKGVRSTKVDVTQHQRVVLPRILTIDGEVQAERRYRSLYEILLYGAQLKLEGHFDFSKQEGLAPEGSTIRWQQPLLVVMVQDTRGLTTIPVLSWDGQGYPINPGNRGPALGPNAGFHSELPHAVVNGGRFAFKVDMMLRGTQLFSWIPLGEETQVKIKANWPHPSFWGRALPKSHRISAQGFEAEWEATHYSTNIPQIMAQGGDQMPSTAGLEVGFRLLQPVDIYLLAERSVKYGLLFVFLTFAAFLLFEKLRQLPIHPIQYSFVGLALVLFYLLLLALSEHMAFAWAYGIATGSSIALLGFYLSHAVGSRRVGLGFGLALGLLYGVMYVILNSEDYALLYGSCLIFLLLSVVMILTRRVNWYALK